MFRTETNPSRLAAALGVAELIFHASVRHVRKSHGNAVVGLVMAIVQTVIMIAVFYFMMHILGMRQMAIRGDFLLFVMSGIFMFMVHNQTMSAVTAAEGPTSAMMKHSPMNPVIAIAAAALGTLYIQLLSASVVLYLYHAIVTPISIRVPTAVLGMLLLAWGSGVGIGMIFLAAKPWAPGFVVIISTLYQRANMIASGKMFLANMMTAKMLAMFDWNPLFHVIDQARGFAFLNYHPHYSTVSYPIKVMVVCAAVGLMGQFYTKRYASVSWQAKG